MNASKLLDLLTRAYHEGREGTNNHTWLELLEVIRTGNLDNASFHIKHDDPLLDLATLAINTLNH